MNKIRLRTPISYYGGKQKTKTEMLVANYPIGEQRETDFDEAINISGDE